MSTAQPTINPNQNATMDNSPLSKCPGELRNTLYELVLSTPSPVVVHIDKHGNPDDAAKNHLAVRSVCRQMHEETKGFPVAQTKTIILMSAETISFWCNKIPAHLFDLGTWMDDIKALPHVNQQEVKCIFEAATIDITHMPHGGAWQTVQQYTIDNVPLEGITRADVDFELILTLIVGPLGTHRLIIPLPDVRGSDAIHDIRDDCIRPLVQRLKRGVVDLTAERTAEKGDVKALAARKMTLWSSIYLAEYAVAHTLGNVYAARDHVRAGRPRHRSRQ